MNSEWMVWLMVGQTAILLTALDHPPQQTCSTHGQTDGGCERSLRSETGGLYLISGGYGVAIKGLHCFARIFREVFADEIELV